MKTAKGVTLIELIMVIVLMGILCSIASKILTQTFKGYFTAKTITLIGNKANIATENIMRELKSAQSLSSLGTSALTFVNQQGNTVVIALSGTTLTRNVNGAGAQTLCTQVTTASFAYFDQAFATTAVATNVRFLTMQIVVTGANGLPYSLMAGTVLRKLLS